MTELARKNGRTLVVGDIHGAYKALMNVLEQANVTTDDTLICLGDYVDGWSESPQVIEFLIDYAQSHHCIFLRGNHEELFVDWLKNGNEDPRWLKHGGIATIDAYRQLPAETKSRHIQFIDSLKNYYIDADNRLFVHAGFTHLKGVKYEYFPAMACWDRSLWETALSLDPNLDREDPRYPARLKVYNEIFVGHTPTVRIGSRQPVQAANVWNLDTGAAFDGPLTIMDVDSKAYWQSPIVAELYPNETARTMF